MAQKQCKSAINVDKATGGRGSELVSPDENSGGRQEDREEEGKKLQHCEGDISLAILKKNSRSGRHIDELVYFDGHD